MNSFELNKLIGALLGTVFIVFSISLLSDAIFASPAPEKPGYVIEAAEGDGHGAGNGGEEAETVTIAELLASADAAAGENSFKKCGACHTAENGGANKVGPNLWNIVNRPVASHEGFSYSGAMKEFSQGGSVVWDYDHLNEFLLAPKGLVNGTAMAFAGLKKDAERANVIAYLRTLSDSPAPLPEPETAAAEEPKADEGTAPEEPAAPAEEGAAPAEEPATPPADEPAPAEPEEETPPPAD